MSLSIDKPNDLTCRRRIRLLVDMHLVCAAAQLFDVMLPLSVAVLPIQWAIASLLLGSVMTFAVWIGLGTQRLQWRILAGIVGGCYLAMWPFVANILRAMSRSAIPELVKTYVTEASEMILMIAILSGMFLLIGRWFELRRVGSIVLPQTTGRIQFSVLHLLLLMLFLSIVLTLLKAARIDLTNRTVVEEPFGRLVATIVLLLIALATNLVCAVFATLRPGAIALHIGLVFAIATLLGVVIAFAANIDQAGLWLFIGMSSMNVLATAVVLTSLLVVRSCGYRLIRRESAN